MSTHRVDVVRIKEIQKHPNADSLGLVLIHGWTCAVRLGDFQPGDLCAYIEPDYIVPSPEEHPAGALFAFLGDKRRIKAKRLRGTWSQGLLVRAPEGAAEGEDVMEKLGIKRWEPPIQFGTDGDAERPCDAIAHVPKFDVENWRRYKHLLVEGEIVCVTEKLHGANARYAFREDRMWCGSRTQWKRPPAEGRQPGDPWWQGLRQNPWIETWCRANPDAVLYGEVFGQVQDLRYDTDRGQIKFAAFAVLRGNAWEKMADFWDFRVDGVEESALRVPLLYVGPYSEAKMEELSMGDSAIAKHLAEGIVITPENERTDPEIGYLQLKLVSNRYLER